MVKCHICPEVFDVKCLLNKHSSACQICNKKIIYCSVYNSSMSHNIYHLLDDNINMNKRIRYDIGFIET